MSNAERVLALLDRWDDLADQGQRPSLDDLCHDCPELRPEVSRAIHARNAWSKLPAATTDEQARTESSPSLPRVTGYEILGVLGGGGMGVVYGALSGGDLEGRESASLRKLHFAAGSKTSVA